MSKPQDEDQEPLERALAGALRAAINDHGPITLALIPSAVKRLVGQLRNAKITGIARVLGARRWRGVPPEEAAAIRGKGGRQRWKGVGKAARTEHAERAGAAGGNSAWANMSANERSEEMKRRAAVRAANSAKEKP